ncbi:ParA family protein [Bdellovibrionota bacterium FG-2]
MEPSVFTSMGITKLFRLDDRVDGVASRQTLYNAEARGEIPKAGRKSVGKNSVRQWTIDQVPSIGERFGFLKKPKKQHVLCIYTAKGGVLKSTLSYSLARMFAMNGIKTLIVGLDIQCSITDIALAKPKAESIDDMKDETGGLYHFIQKEATIDEIVKATDLPTLHVIPETAELLGLEKTLRNTTRKEYVFKEQLLPHLKNYEIIIFDNGPNWSQLVENALVAASTVISPVGCDIGTYKALSTNLEHIQEFGEAAKTEWDHFLVVPTLLEKAKLSQQIYGAYISQLGETLLPNPIRRAVGGQESIVMAKSMLEHDPSSLLAQDYYDLAVALWKRIEE